MWREMSLLFAVVLLFGLLGAGESTNCKTKETCKKSLFMTGECTNGQCVCDSKYSPGPFGCQEKQTSKVTAPFDTMETGSKGKLTCSPKGLDNAYEWYKGIEKLSEKTSQFSIDEAKADDNGAIYTCQSLVSGILTKKSDGVTVNVDDNPTDRPIVTGMPTAVGAGMKVMFECTTTVNWKDPKYTWVLDSSPVGGETSAVYTHTVEAGNAGKKLKCTLGGTESTVTTFPVSLATTLTGVKVVSITNLKLQKGEKLSLSCELTDFPAYVSGDETVKYSWKKGTEAINGATANNYGMDSVDLEHAGSYTCSAELGNNTPVESNAVELTVATTMKKPALIKSANVFNNGSYYSLTCEYTGPPEGEYSWMRDGIQLLGVTDNMLQFNDVGDDSVVGKYVCKVTDKAGTGSVLSDEVLVQSAGSSTLVASLLLLVLTAVARQLF